jgi:hypothetical protein
MRYDYSFLNTIEPYKNDTKEIFDIRQLDNEISRLSEEISNIDIKTVPFDKWDFIVVFSVALIEVGADFILGDPQKGLSKTLSDKNTKLGEFFDSIHKKLDHSGQPLDYQGPHFGGGDHRGRTFGHDLFMFPLAIYMLCKGKFIDGYFEDGAFKWIISTFNQFGTEYAGMPLDQAIISYVIHMVADFFSSKSLPVPGMGMLAHFPNRDIRKLVSDMYSNGFNLRHIIIQGIPVLSAEILIRIFVGIKYWKNTEHTKNMIKNKQNKMLLLSHSCATVVNIGKVIITKNPTLINLPMILRVINLAWKVVKDEIDITHRAIEKINLNTLKNKLELEKTLILLDETVYYTGEIDKIILAKMKSFDQNLQNNRMIEEKGIEEFNNILLEYKEINKEIYDE